MKGWVRLESDAAAGHDSSQKQPQESCSAIWVRSSYTWMVPYWLDLPIAFPMRMGPMKWKCLTCNVQYSHVNAYSITLVQKVDCTSLNQKDYYQSVIKYVGRQPRIGFSFLILKIFYVRPLKCSSPTQWCLHSAMIWWFLGWQRRVPIRTVRGINWACPSRL